MSGIQIILKTVSRRSNILGCALLDHFEYLSVDSSRVNVGYSLVIGFERFCSFGKPYLGENQQFDVEMEGLDQMSSMLSRSV